MSAKMTPRELRQLNEDVAEQFELLGVCLPGGGDFFEKPGWQLALVAATGTAARAAEAKAAARERRNDRIGDDPIAADYLLDNDDVGPIVDEGDGVHVDDSDDDWEGHDATPELDRYFPRGKQKPSDAKGTDSRSALAKFLRTDGGGTGRPDHESAERRSSPMEKYLERPAKRNKR